MAELIQSFDSYRDFEPSAYYTICFDQMASLMSLELKMTETGKNIEAVLQTMDLDSQQLVLIFKNWNTEDSKNADFSKDFPYQYLYKSENQRLVIWIALDYGQLKVDFYYDTTNEALEQWVIATNHRLRSEFGTERMPVFKVLVKDSHGYDTDDVKTQPFKIDVHKNYNDDFLEVHEIIEESLNVEKAGLILFHGVPGSGKTSYIKSLINEHSEKPFIFIQNEFINALLQPDFISFLLRNQNAVLIIEDAEKVLMSREEANESSVVSTILQLTDGLFSDYLNIKIICTFNTSINKIDKALLRKGRMLAYYEFGPLSADKADALLIEQGHESVHQEMTLAEVFNYQKKDFDQDKKRAIGFRR